MAKTSGSRSALFVCAVMLGVAALAGCNGGGGGSKTGSATASAVPGSNTPPTISGSAATTASLDTNYSFTPTASDADGDTLSFQIQNKPAWATFNTVTGQLSGRPTEGTFSNIIISASDGKASAQLPAFSIRAGEAAAGVGDKNVTLSWIAPTQNVDGSALTDLAGFVVSYGTSSTALSESVRIDNPSVDRYVVDGLVAGQTYYFGVRALAASGAESELSELASKQVM